MLLPVWVPALMPCPACFLLLWSLSIFPANSGLGFSVLPVDTVGMLSHQLMLHCAVHDPSPQSPVPVKWWRATGSLSPSVHQMANGSLLFPKLAEEDLGTYICSGQAGPHLISTTVEVSKAYLEKVFFSPRPQVVSEGQDIFLQCVSGDSSPPALLSWLKDGEPASEGRQIQGQYGGGNQKKTSGTLHLANVTKADEGLYICVTHNPLLETPVKSTAAKLTVQGSSSGLEILQGPSNTTVPTGLTAAMRCAVRGFPSPTIQWMKDGQPLQNASHWSLLNRGQLLVFKQVLQEDEGMYHCEAKNKRDRVRSQPALLLPAAMEWSFVRQPANTTVRRGDAVSLPCRPPRSSPPAQVSWFKNNRLLQPLPHLGLELSGDLLFHSVEEKDRGFYFCRASNSHLQRAITSRKIYLDVLAPPSVTIWPEVVMVPVGAEVVIHCQVLGHPVPTIEFSKQGLSIHTGGKISIGVRNATIYISSVRIHDEGLYTCKASNSEGHDQRTSTLQIAVKPVIVSFEESVSTPVGATAALPCGAVGDPPIIYTWSRGGFQNPLLSVEEKSVDDKGTLTISNAHQSDSGEYHCTAQNSLGEDRRRTFLLITEEATDDRKLSTEMLSPVTMSTLKQVTSATRHTHRVSEDIEMTGPTSPITRQNSDVFYEYLRQSTTHISIAVTSHTHPPWSDLSEKTNLHKGDIKSPTPTKHLSPVLDMHNHTTDPMPLDSHTQGLHTPVSPTFTRLKPRQQPPTLNPPPQASNTPPLPTDPHSPSQRVKQSVSTTTPPPLALHTLSRAEPTPSFSSVPSDMEDMATSASEQPHQNQSRHVEPAGPTKSSETNKTDLNEWPKKNTSQSPMRTTDNNASTKKQPPAWLPVLEKHDIPIVVGVGVSLAFIFLTMAFYSLVRKNDPAAPTRRAALRNLGAPCRHGDRLVMDSTYENRAFEDDNMAAVIEQSPHTSDTRAQPPASSPTILMMEPPHEAAQEEALPTQDMPVIVETHTEPTEDDQTDTSLEEGKLTPPPTDTNSQLQCVENWRSSECGQCQDAPAPSPPPPPSLPPPAQVEGLHSSLTLQTSEPCTTPIRHSLSISHCSSPLLLSHCVSLGATSVAVDVHFYPPSAPAPAPAPMGPAPGAGRLGQTPEREQSGPAGPHCK